jgi:hypothetical protein
LSRYVTILCLKPLKKCYTVWEHDPFTDGFLYVRCVGTISKHA